MQRKPGECFACVPRGRTTCIKPCTHVILVLSHHVHADFIINFNKCSNFLFACKSSQLTTGQRLERLGEKSLSDERRSVVVNKAVLENNFVMYIIYYLYPHIMSNNLWYLRFIQLKKSKEPSIGPKYGMVFILE